MRLVFAVALTLTAVTTGAQAAVVQNVYGTVCEGGVDPAAISNCPASAGTLALGDFNTNLQDPTLKIVGDTRIWGGVAHRNSSQNKFFDNFSLDLGTQAYIATFNWQVKNPGFRPNFDGRIVIGGTLVGGNVVGGDTETFTTDVPNGPDVISGSINLGTLSGDGITVIIDPIFGAFADNPDEVGTWDFELTQVPLPASALLLLAGLGGLGALRRRIS